MKSGRLHLRLLPSLKEDVMKIAQKNGTTLSAMVEEYLRRVVEAERQATQPPVDAEQI